MVTYGEMLAGPQTSPAQSVSLNLTSCNLAQRYRGQGEARETLKAAMKNRPPVAEIVKEITKVFVKVKVVLKN